MHTYHDRILVALESHGLVPAPHTPPQLLQDAVSDLYRYEIRRLRSALLAGRILKLDYARHVVELRKRYWVLSVPLSDWLVSGPDAPDCGR
jgi:hypothetical protein